MSSVTLSSVIRANPRLVSSSLEKMMCNAQGITVVDIYPSVLSALTAKGAPASVAESARAFVQTSRCSRCVQRPGAERDSGRVWNERATSSGLVASSGVGISSSSNSPLKQKKSSENEDSYMNCFNVGIAMSLHTVLLSRNRISNLLGMVQFRHCVCLSLLGNRIRTIEDCEPLAMLPELQYLSLEYNPVTQLPHYRAHLLRICSWPHELSPSTCRLRKLDSAAVTTVEVKRAMLCLLRESSLLPELLYRMQLLAFLVDIENRQRLHRELRQRGHIFCDSSEDARMELLLERGVAHALSRVGVAGAAHMARQLVRDRRLLCTTSSSRRECSSAPSAGAEAPPAPTLASPTDDQGVCVAANKNSGRAAGVTSTTVTYFGSDVTDPGDITSISTVSSCSLLSGSSSSHAKVLQSLSHLLASKELDWSRRSMRRADASEAAEVCKSWSTDAFRQTIAFLDVRLCTLLLHISRILGQTLTSHDVDRLCEVWLHAVSHCTPAEAAEVNATGPRRLVVDFGAAATGRKTTKKGAASGQVAVRQREAFLGTAVTGGTPEEGMAHVRTSIQDALEKAPQCALSNASSPQKLENRDSENATMSYTKVSMTSLSSDPASLPRNAVPVPTARPPTGQAPLMQPCREVTESTVPGAPAHTLVQGAASSKATSCADSIHACEARVRSRCKRRVFQQWCSALRHRWQTRIVAAYVVEKVSGGAAAHLRSPSWGGLLSQVTYGERKRGFFTLWRRRAQLRRDCRTRRLRSVWSVWREKAAAMSMLRRRCEQTSALAAQRVRAAVFHTWKSKAEKRAGDRCAAARRRIMAHMPHSTATVLTLASPKPVTTRLAARTPPPRVTVLRHTLADALMPSRDTCTTAAAAPSFTTASDEGLSDARASATASPVITSVWRPSAAHERCPCSSHSSASVSENVMRDNCRARSSSDDEAGLSAVGTTPSPGVSATSCAATPFLCACCPEGSQQPCDTKEAQALSGDLTRELSPPPAIRALFPTDLGVHGTGLSRSSHTADAAAVQLQPSSPSRAPPPFAFARIGQSAVVLTPSARLTSSRFYSASKPSRLPSTTAARRAIVQASSTTEKSAAVPGEVESPYPAADVEALVEQAKQLEIDRNYLIETLRSLHFSPQRHCAQEWLQRSHATCRVAPVPLSSPAPRAPSFTVVEQLEGQCAGLEKEVHRLEKLVSALQDERHQYLEAIKSEMFRYSA
ncbi:hypothetical protein JIQ42_01678 [Leishmania sp. Namibia]|uniref:hypothetical protein n=1 Tax=Leishmania sp. Namibia TaxID=2802991 RepID=UPI001B62318E|nr:hypothetical protein JIQ42_01678 [Leishmania sp. Namibia]